MGYPATPIAHRFSAKIEPDLNSGCWLWSDAPDRYGYGRLQVGKKTMKAHRVSFEMHHGPIPDGHMVCHRCDTPACVNPAHLFSGAANDNVQDMVVKGRYRAGGKPMPGAANGRAVIETADAVDLLLRVARGDRIVVVHEAQRLGVNRTAIDRLMRGQSWRHLPRDTASLIALYGAQRMVV